ncbi:MAG: hypothetical protein HZB26_05810 [Candidatus Hydrogenedentes bacterium]|nr:hypothetical protein [Candidatus Hydrogenedentota bacterium]
MTRILILAGLALAQTTHAAGVATPIEGLALWLDASDSAAVHVENGRVNKWDNKAPAARNALSSSGEQRPKYIAAVKDNMRPAVRFDGVDDVVRDTAFRASADTWTLIVVAAPVAPCRGGALCSARSTDGHDYDPGFTVDQYESAKQFDSLSVEGAGRIGGQKNQLRVGHAFGGMHVVTVAREEKTIRVFVDGEEQAPRPVNPARTLLDEVRVGARYYAGQERNYFHGDIAEVLLYKRVLTDAERASIESSRKISPEEQKAREEHAMLEAQERLKNRMIAPRVTAVWPSVAAFLAAQGKQDVRNAALHVDIKEAISLGVTHLNSLFDRDKDGEPFFYANREADGTGKMHHSVNIGIPHVVGRCLLGGMEGELAAGVPFPPEGLAILERYLRSSFDNPDHLNSYYDPARDGKRFIEFHNMREGLYGLWALAAGRNSAWAKDTAHAMLETLNRLTDEQGRWSTEKAKALGMAGRCEGFASSNSTRLVDPLLAYYRLTQDPLAIKLAGLYAKDGLKTLFTEDGHFAPMDRSSGHVHSITSSLSGITAYAIFTHDAAMLDACRKIMDVGVPGYHTSWGWGDEVFPEHPADVQSRGEINQTGDVVRTALLLGDAGYPQYYDVADRFLRGMLLPTQHRPDEMAKYLKNKPNPADDSEKNVLERSVGGYAMQLPNDRMQAGDWPLTTLDITSGAVHALSECYRSRVTSSDGVTYRMNLLFDFENSDLKIVSGLPWTGRVEIETKAAGKTVLVRLPGCVDAKTLTRKENAAAAPAEIEDGCVKLANLPAGAKVTLSFDLPFKIEKETVDNIEYTTTWIGNQVIEIQPRGGVSPLPF